MGGLDVCPPHAWTVSISLMPRLVKRSKIVQNKPVFTKEVANLKLDEVDWPGLFRPKFSNGLGRAVTAKIILELGFFETRMFKMCKKFKA